MPKKVPLSEAHAAWLTDNHRTTTYPAMAAHIGCCVDTLKRILVRLGLQEFDGAKYQTSAGSRVETWNRPCMDCGCRKPRPKAWFFCRPCRLKREYEND